eukprot:snap_masked-scaffold_23-processed-gene-5.19-mRNA-1 protein AED:0.01 eAED:0.01 QI:0/-1/0/1/-1/1/1/0/199
MKIINIYLLAYNAFAFLGWAYIFGLIFTIDKPEELLHPLLIVQTSAILEIFHSLLGFVRSPVTSVSIQVFSRVAVLWGFSKPYSSTEQSFILMVASWSFIELFRYSFYFLTLLDAKVPRWLFFGRYTLFIILYPSGISGEILQILNSLHQIDNSNIKVAVYGLLGLYVPFGPYMILNMFKMRKRAYKKLEEKNTKKKSQ